MNGNPIMQMLQNQNQMSSPMQMQNPMMSAMQNNGGNLLEAMKQSAPQLKQMFGGMNGLNPQDIMQKMMGDNPMMNMAMGNPEQTVRGILQKQGIDVNEFMNTLQGILQ